LHALAEEQIRYNCELLAPGLTFRQFTERAWKIPARYWEQNYGCVAHGVGMVDEWPAIGVDPRDPCLQDGVMAPGMVICVESYLGEVGGTEGVKLEEQVLITTGGHEILSRYPIALATTA
jgi:Xaa-Pro aminopeptidase